MRTLAGLLSTAYTTSVEGKLSITNAHHLVPAKRPEAAANVREERLE